MYANITHINRELANTKTVKGEYYNVLPDHCIDHKTFESRATIFQVYNLDQQAFQLVAALKFLSIKSPHEVQALAYLICCEM